ncbi:MAG: ABC transporter ATP-binding protein [Rhodobacteraceae bacterium]|nr:ABC transporter ATP-binding protein [Paracoccaceae bacterium]
MDKRPELLSVKQLGKTFNGEVEALRGMNLTVNSGDFVSLLGPSGCGKSTVLRMIAGLMEPTTGRIGWQGEHGSGSIGVVFQEPTLMPWASVEKNVWLPFRLAGQSLKSARPRIREALGLVGLEEFSDSYPRELSGGMKMRVSIARALATNPRVILMDEPFAALDEITRFKLNHDLLELKSKIGCTILFVTHSVFESVFLSDRIAVMTARPGRVLTEITVGEPYPRDDDFRTSSSYAAYCRVTSESLQQSMLEAA